ncbi:hypothetical protein D3C71_1926700 [compost metagenome]
MELPTPQSAAYFSSVVILAGPETPICTGKSMPEAASPSAQAMKRAGSKPNWVTMRIAASLLSAKSYFNFKAAVAVSSLKSGLPSGWPAIAI